MYTNGTNTYGCPLLNQTGSTAVKNFDTIIARLSPDLQAAFKAEQKARQQELIEYQRERRRYVTNIGRPIQRAWRGAALQIRNVFASRLHVQ